MTNRLYYRDPALLEFDGTVLSTAEANGRFRTILDQSAFYPTSGGQLFDTGVLGKVQVIEVVEEGEDVVHITDQPVGASGSTIHGQVDRRRRQVHRQQHTAQHILSQIAVRRFSFETVSVHLGDDYGAIELDTPAIESAQIEELEEAAAEILTANWPVSILFVSGPALEQLPLRKVPTREGELRVIRIGEFDYSACGGTHCSSTAEVGLIKIIGWEKLRGHALVKFLAGQQALDDYRVRFNLTDALSRSMTCHPSDIPSKVEKLTSENKDQRRELTLLYKEVLPQRAASLASEAVTIGTHLLVYKALEGMDSQTAAQLASLIADKTNGLALLVCEGKLLLATGSSSGLHAGELARQLGGTLGLKGGGSNRAAQLGGVDKAKLEEYRSALLTLIGHA